MTRVTRFMTRLVTRLVTRSVMRSMTRVTRCMTRCMTRSVTRGTRFGDAMPDAGDALPHSLTSGALRLAFPTARPPCATCRPHSEGMKQKAALDVVETPLHFSGEPAMDMRRDRRIIVDDICSVHSHSCRSAAGWHPVCTLQFYGAEEVTLALDAIADRRDAQVSADELAEMFRMYVDEDRFDDLSEYRNGWPCAACMSSGMPEPKPTRDTLGNDTTEGTTS